MATASPLDSNTHSNEPHYTQDDRTSPPAFLDLADSVSCVSSLFSAWLNSPRKAARLGTNMPDISAVSPKLHVTRTHPLTAVELNYVD